MDHACKASNKLFNQLFNKRRIYRIYENVKQLSHKVFMACFFYVYMYNYIISLVTKKQVGIFTNCHTIFLNCLKLKLY